MRWTRMGGRSLVRWKKWMLIDKKDGVRVGVEAEVEGVEATVGGVEGVEAKVQIEVEVDHLEA